MLIYTKNETVLVEQKAMELGISQQRLMENAGSSVAKISDIKNISASYLLFIKNNCCMKERLKYLFLVEVTLKIPYLLIPLYE